MNRIGLSGYRCAYAQTVLVSAKTASTNLRMIFPPRWVIPAQLPPVFWKLDELTDRRTLDMIADIPLRLIPSPVAGDHDTNPLGMLKDGYQTLRIAGLRVRCRQQSF